MDRSLVISALTNSWQNQNYPNNVILHSDRGSQYTSSEYIAAAERMGFRLSYSKKGCPFDNAPMESFHSVLKKEEVYLKHYSSFHEANIRLFDYINGFYNRNRIHSAINFLSPIQFENSLFYSYFFSPFCVQIIDYGPFYTPSLIWNWAAKTQPVFQKKQKFRKFPLDKTIRHAIMSKHSI